MGESNDGIAGGIFAVTGGTQGVGETVALALAGAGAAGIVICGRNARNGARVKEALEEKGAEAEFVEADLEVPGDCRKVIAACDTRFGRIDGLLNAAGLTERGTIEDTTVELWDRMFAINARAPFILMQDAIKLMRREGTAGSIVNIITISSYGGQPKLTPYAASKGALVVLTKNVAHSVRFDRIRVNGINLGWTDTPGEHRVQRAEGRPEDWLVKAEAELPFGRLVQTGDVAALCLFLFGAASGVMTGAVVDFDQTVMGALD
ncbi:MAG: SDR family oxidoreductase [Proteobacteria bacterium]|nr:SDR family oxidoreductase [Pseudomonadota bacterium]